MNFPLNAWISHCHFLISGEGRAKMHIFTINMIETHPRSRAMLGHKVTTVNDYLCTKPQLFCQMVGKLIIHLNSCLLQAPSPLNMEYIGIWWNMDIPKAPSIFLQPQRNVEKMEGKKPGSNFHGSRSPMSCSMQQPPRKDDNSSSVEVRSRANP